MQSHYMEYMVVFRIHSTQQTLYHVLILAFLSWQVPAYAVFLSSVNTGTFSAEQGNKLVLFRGRKQYMGETTKGCFMERNESFFPLFSCNQLYFNVGCKKTYH